MIFLRKWKELKAFWEVTQTQTNTMFSHSCESKPQTVKYGCSGRNKKYKYDNNKEVISLRGSEEETGS